MTELNNLDFILVSFGISLLFFELDSIRLHLKKISEKLSGKRREP